MKSICICIVSSTEQRHISFGWLDVLGLMVFESVFQSIRDSDVGSSQYEHKEGTQHIFSGETRTKFLSYLDL